MYEQLRMTVPPVLSPSPRVPGAFLFPAVRHPEILLGVFFYPKEVSL
jgi:hypothetical protein